MLQTTRGIVLKTIPYSDNSVIAKVYTQAHGLQSFMINGVHAKRGPSKASSLQPLTLLELVIYHKEKKQLQKIKELKVETPFTSIPYHLLKRSIAMFVAELLEKTIREEETNEALFDFLHQAILILDLQESGYTNFHLQFMLQLSKYMGFSPQGTFAAATPVFDLQEGMFVAKLPAHSFYITQNPARLFSQLCEQPFSTLAEFDLSYAERKELLERLILYYQLHMPSFKSMVSHRILEEVIS